jgi:hypothetical protein
MSSYRIIYIFVLICILQEMVFDFLKPILSGQASEIQIDISPTGFRNPSCGILLHT